MTPEAVEAAIEAGDVQACLALFAHATEAQRAAVAKRTVARFKALTAGIPGRWLPLLDHVSAQHLAHFGVVLRPGVLQAGRVAVLACASFSALKRLGARAVPSPDEAYTVLAARRPPWVGEWVALALERDNRSFLGYWPLVRRLVREGLCPRPTDVRYLDGMLTTLSTRVGHAKKTLRELLLDDPGLLDDEIWMIFETEPRPGALSVLSDMSIDDAPFCWRTALVALADEGRIPRSRLLDASLDALERDFPEARSRWYAHFHEALRPSASERAGCAERYLGLLASRNPTTVTFAVKALGAVRGDAPLDDQRVIESIGPALQARAKTTVKAALALLDQAAERTPALSLRASIAAAEALVHEAPDVHGLVLDFIERRGDPGNAELTSLLGGRIDAVAPSHRPRLEAWLGAVREVLQPEPVDDIDSLQARVAALDPRLAKCAGVFAALEAARSGGGPAPAATPGALEIPRLDPARRIEPVNHLDTLVDLFSAVLESPDSPDDVERLLDGVSRLCDQRPGDFEARLGSLVNRIEQQQQLVQQGRIFVILLVKSLWGLALSWSGGKVVAPGHDASGYLGGFFRRRVLAVSERVVLRQAAPLLSAPTHAGGWINPLVLVARRKAWQELAATPDPRDEALALLRLAPDHRAEALAQAREIDGEFGAALRHALGGDGESIGTDVGLWVAAARARAPEADDEQVEQQHPGLGPDTGRASRFKLVAKPPSRPGNDYLGSLHIQREPPLPFTYREFQRTGPAVDLPTVLLHDLPSHGLGLETRWAATVWPFGLEAFCSVGFERLAGHDRGLHAALAARPYLEALLDSRSSLGPVARLFLGIALSAQNPELSGLATDTLITTIDDGRLDASGLGEALRALLPTGLVKLTRWARTLGDAARISPLHAQVIAWALQHALIDDLTWAPKDLHALLERLKELLIAIGESLSEPQTRESLSRLTRSGKTGKLVQDLLALQESADLSPRREAVRRALAHRIERAEQWTRWVGDSPGVISEDALPG